MRMRVVGWEVRPVVMADDGDNLTQVPIRSPAFITAADWEQFKDGGDLAALDAIRGQVEAGLPCL
jgi:hypothetical protein